MLIGITRVRNEALIIEDTLSHVLGIVDHVILYDDCSTDRTVKIARDFDRVTVMQGDEWRSDRPAEETRHRALLLGAARRAKAEWVYCFDADERVVDPLPILSVSGQPTDSSVSGQPTDSSRGDQAHAYRFRLYDGYMTPDCARPYFTGKLVDLPRKWGPEYRDIVMLFRADKSEFMGRDARQPEVRGKVQLANVRVKHFGKCLSVRHWEETCDYYANHWPEPYRTKWVKRRGKALHDLSDFGLPLYEWDEVDKHGRRL
jgi:glycosyltransferase involved in cell wall biosynthesis